jgi:hypothetical protein
MMPLMPTSMKSTFLLLLLTLTLTLGLGPGCGGAADGARVYRVTERAQLIGGPHALGEVGDWLIENNAIRIVIQDEGFSRGVALYGGNIIDADLVRLPTGAGDSTGGQGMDNFGELLPAFFLEAIEPCPGTCIMADGKKHQAIEIENAGGNGEAAVLRLNGYGTDFLAMVQSVNEILTGDSRDQPTFEFVTRYILEPGAHSLRIETTITNIDVRTKRFPAAELDGQEIPTPFGDVVLFGAGNEVFMPHAAGFDLRFALEKENAPGRFTLPAIPGLVAEFIATAGRDVSYGILPEEPKAPLRSYVYENKDQFREATPHSVHIPFIASSFTGVFQALPPDRMEPEESSTWTRHFIVGDGSVASISDQVFHLLGDEVGTFSGQVREGQTHLPVKGARVIVFDGAGRKVTVATSDAQGNFKADLRPGDYGVRVKVTDRQATGYSTFSIKAGQSTGMNLQVEPPAQLVVSAVSKTEGPIPAKITVVGISPREQIGVEGRHWLYDLSIGEHWRYTDMIPDTEDPDTRRYIEAIAYADAQGLAHLTVRPGIYQVIVSRGFEYETSTQEVTLKPGHTAVAMAELDRVVDTGGYLSGDFHLHSIGSLDSWAQLDDRVHSYAGEGLEVAISSDHNFVTDYGPALARQGLQPFLATAVGVELSTLDRGHFNGFPIKPLIGGLEKDPKKEGAYLNTEEVSTFGSPLWVRQPPQKLFDGLRKFKMDDVDSLVQVNHARAPVMGGYFTEYGLNQDSLVVQGKTGLVAPKPATYPEFAVEAFSWDFDVLELMNGKNYEYLENLKIPAGSGSDPVSGCAVFEGESYRRYADEGDCVPAEIAFPGVVEDWFHILSAGKRIIGTANSDSHSNWSGEPGAPRTFFRAPSDSPLFLRPADIVAGLKGGDVIMSHGPFLTVSAEGEGAEAVHLGGEVEAASANGEIKVKVRLQAASWVKVDTVEVLGITWNAATESLDIQRDVHEVEDAGRGAQDQNLESTLIFGKDGYVVVRARGSESMFPMLYPKELRPMDLTQITSSLGGALGFGGEGGFEPEQVYHATPWALTNPIWVDADGDGNIEMGRALPIPGEDLPSAGVGKRPGPDFGGAHLGGLPGHGGTPRIGAAHPNLPKWLWPSDDPRDLRRLLHSAGCDH